MKREQAGRSSRESPRYTALHRHSLPGRGHTLWSEGVVDGRHSHGLENSESLGFVADCVGSPVHRHAWTIGTPRRTERGYTSGPVLERALVPPVSWFSRMLRR